MSFVSVTALCAPVPAYTARTIKVSACISRAYRHFFFFFRFTFLLFL